MVDFPDFESQIRCQSMDCSIRLFDFPADGPPRINDYAIPGWGLWLPLSLRRANAQVQERGPIRKVKQHDGGQVGEKIGDGSDVCKPLA